MAIEASVWIYWLFCLIATLLLLSNQQFADTLLSPALGLPRKEENYLFWLVLGWGFTLLASTTYILLTVRKQTGFYHLSDLILFSILNGILEQFMFIFWFLLGCYLVQKTFPEHTTMIFVGGYLSYFIYSGAIHGLFWFQLWPEHDPFMPVALFALMSFFWMWLFWRYKAVLAIVAMHVVIDFLTVGYLHFGLSFS